MLNKTKKQILSMMDTLGEALTQYIARPQPGLLTVTTDFISAIQTLTGDECGEVPSRLALIKTKLENFDSATVTDEYNYCLNCMESIPVQYKAVFLPYYGDTWDSLKSAYEAFAADARFVTEVVIIPILRNTPSGWMPVYNDYLTPVGIPNTYYAHYDVKQDQPDFIFYNNPYNGVNLKQFQFANLQPYAGCMVYVPYYIYLFRNIPTRGARLQKFINLPGHNYADVIIAQGLRLKKELSPLSVNGKKLVPLGNPKMDEIYKNLSCFHAYPDWENKLAGKRVFLLNTHHSVVVNDGFKILMNFIFALLDEDDSLAVIWRPHPQSFIFMDSADAGNLRRQDWQGFIGRAEAHPRMVLDRTVNATSAIMRSNAVISHLSSIIAQSIFADKPVFVVAPMRVNEDGLEKILAMTYKDYKRARKQQEHCDASQVYLHNAVYHMSHEYVNYQKEIDYAYRLRGTLPNFVNDIKNGVDTKKDLRKLYREQTCAPMDGKCGQRIHDYVAGHLLGYKRQP